MSEPPVLPRKSGEHAGGPGPSAELRARVLGAVAQESAPTRAAHRMRTLMTAAAGVVMTTILFVALGGLRQGTRPAELVAFTSGLGLVAALGFSQLALGRGRSMLGRPRHELMILCFALAPTLAAVAVAAAALWPLDSGDKVATHTHVVCGLLTLLYGVSPLGVLLVIYRGTDPLHPALTGAVLGTTAGAWAAMVAYLRCPHAEPVHCVVAHVVPTVLLAVLGVFLGRALLKLRWQGNA